MTSSRIKAAVSGLTLVDGGSELATIRSGDDHGSQGAQDRGLGPTGQVVVAMAGA
jgi:hypothetical protein